MITQARVRPQLWTPQCPTHAPSEYPRTHGESKQRGVGQGPRFSCSQPHRGRRHSTDTGRGKDRKEPWRNSSLPAL